jgi:hypothetical protein
VLWTTRRCAVFAALLSSATLTVGCSTSTGSTGDEFARVAGVILPNASFASRALIVPDSVRAGVPFAVTVSSFGSTTCTRADGATLTVVGVVATITVWDREQVGGGCSDDLRQFPRDVSVQLGSAGRAMIRVQGRAYPATAGGRDSLVVIEKEIVVR